MPHPHALSSLEASFVDAFEAHAGQLAQNGSGPVHAQPFAVGPGLRRQALERFRDLGIPSRKNEAWKYTNMPAALADGFALPSDDLPADSLPAHWRTCLLAGLDVHLVVLVNGRFSSAHSSLGALPEGVAICGLGDAARSHPEILRQHLGRYADWETESLTALNTAFARDGLFVYVPKGTVLEKPIHVLHLSETKERVFLQPRRLLAFEENTQVRMIDMCCGLTGEATFTNAVTEIFVGERAMVEMYLVQDPGNDHSIVSTTHAYQEAASAFSTTTVTLSGHVVRNNLNVLPDAPHCETHLYGLFLPTGASQVDNRTLVDHAKPDCVSNELYKGVLNDRASGVFNGKVFVRQDAQRINAFQENKSIILSGDATMNAKPELEIYADDVKCSHGATTGQLDPEALFYLRSRGMTKQQAQGLLLHAFAGDVLDRIAIEPLRDMLDERVTRLFGE